MVTGAIIFERVGGLHNERLQSEVAAQRYERTTKHKCAKPHFHCGVHELFVKIDLNGSKVERKNTYV